MALVVHTAKLGEDFLGKVESFILKEKLLDKPQRLAVVFSGKRPAGFLKKRISQHIKRPYLAPAFFSWEEFVGYLLAQKRDYGLLGALDANFFIYKLARGIFKDKYPNFAQFLPWGEEILRFIEQVDLEKINPQALSDLEKAAVIGFEVPQNINLILQNIFSLRQKLHAEMEKSGYYRRGFIYQKAQAAIQEGVEINFDHIIIGGLFYLHRTEREILKALSRQKEVHLFLQGDSRNWQTFKKLGEDLKVKISPGVGLKRPQMELYAAGDIHSQALALRCVLEKVENLEKTVVVLLEPDNLMVFLSHIASLVEDFNVSLGFPLKRSPIYYLIEKVFQAQLSRQKKMYYASDYLNVIKHPYCKNIAFGRLKSEATRILVHKIEESLISPSGISSLFVDLKALEEDENIVANTLTTLKNLKQEATAEDVQDIMRHLHRMFFSAWEDIDTPYALCVALRRLLENMYEKSLVNRYALHLKAAEEIFSLLDEFEKSKFAKEKFSFADLAKIFSRSLEERLIAFSGTPLSGLQILGFFETRDLSFENVVFVGLNEGVLPKLRLNPPLIPCQVMQALGLERIEQEEEIQRYHFRRLIASAKKVFFVFCQNKEKTKSRFLEQIIWEEEKAKKHLGALADKRVEVSINIQPEEEKVKKTPAVIKYLKEEFVFSASALDVYLHCPLRFYYAYVLRLKEKDDISSEWDSSQIGNFIHNFLCKAYEPFLHKKFSCSQKFKENFFKLFAEEFEAVFGQSGHSDAFILKEIMLFRLRKFLEYEAKRLPGEILLLEEELKFFLKAAGHSFNFTAKLDRAEKRQKGKILILDYKTGSASLLPDKRALGGFVLERKAISENIRSFQLPLYFYALGQEFPSADINAALYLLKGPEFKYLFGEDEKTDVKKRIWEEVFLPALKFILAEITNKDIDFEPDKDDDSYCAHCPFVHMCR